MGRYDGPATVEWEQDGCVEIRAVRCVVDSRSDVWQGRLVTFPPPLLAAWSILDRATLRLPGGTAAPIRPAIIRSDRANALGFLGEGPPPF
jgi:hypothetical protein